MISISEALKIIEKETFLLETETVDAENCIGRILAENIKADTDLPPFDRSQMDGFAVRSDDTKNTPARLKIIGESAAGKGFEGKIKRGEAVRIMTGARVPKGVNAVQKIELVNENEGFVEILETAKANQNINFQGAEIKRGAKVFDKGEIITKQMIAAIASFGYAKIKVFQKPKVKIFSTGSEIVEIGEKPGKDQIRNSNSIMLKTFAEATGIEAEILPIVKDDYETLKTTVSKILGINKKARITTPECEILIITGGVSVGDYDFTKPIIKELGAEILFEKVALKPGKPTVFAKKNNCLIFGLPGNPVSAAVTFFLFVRQAILLMQSARNSGLRKGFAVVTEKIKAAKERDSMLPVAIESNEKGQLSTVALRFSGSSDFIEFARANALIFVPQGKNLEPNDIAEIFFLD